jgi:hypothetical protein
MEYTRIDLDDPVEMVARQQAALLEVADRRESWRQKKDYTSRANR